MALNKEALSFAKLGDAATAKLLFERLVQDYPASIEARIAGIKIKHRE